MQHKRSLTFVAFLLCAALLPLGPLHAEKTAEEIAASKLTGGTTRDWLAGDVRTWMGSDASCTSGQAYHFSHIHELRIEECVDGKRLESKTTWNLKADGPLDVDISIGAEIYILLFYTRDGRQHMILRERSDSKIDPVKDHEFVLSED